MLMSVIFITPGNHPLNSTHAKVPTFLLRHNWIKWSLILTSQLLFLGGASGRAPASVNRDKVQLLRCAGTWARSCYRFLAWAFQAWQRLLYQVWFFSVLFHRYHRKSLLFQICHFLILWLCYHVVNSIIKGSLSCFLESNCQV